MQGFGASNFGSVGAMKRILLSLVSLMGCGSTPMAAVVPIFGSPQAESVTLEGRIDGILFQNINKAQGRYTYNVDVRVAHEGILGSSHDVDREPGEFRVRVHKVYWSQMSAAEQDVVAPDGPKHTMEVERWQNYVVGEPVSLEVAPWSAGRGALRFPESTRSTSPDQ